MVTELRARSIVKAYPTLRSLLEAYDANAGSSATSGIASSRQNDLLSDIVVRT